MINTSGITRELRDSGGGVPFAWLGLLTRGVVVVVLGGHAVGCAKQVVEAGLDTSEGEAVLAALEHVAGLKWEQERPTLVRGRAAVAYRGEKPLSEPTRGFLDAAFEARGWRWSTEDPLVPTGNCFFPSEGDCRLKDPTELHLTFSVWPWPGEADYAGEPSGLPEEEFYVEPVAGEEGYKVHVQWLSSYYSQRRDRDQAELGGEGVLVTRETDGWTVKSVMTWIT